MINFKLNDTAYSLPESAIAELFHVVYYNSRVWERTTWFGQQILKNPFDMWLYQELIFRLRPHYIIESGTFRGGSALFYAHIFDLLGQGEIVTVDIADPGNRPQHPRIHYITGSSIDPVVKERVLSITGSEVPLVILDADHSETHVSQEIKVWAPHVKVGGFLVVEDSNINGHPVRPDFGPGPFEAIEQFLSRNNDFEYDTYFDKFFMTQNPRGWLRRKD
jgi:cephalosporin hydroxylase